MLLVKVFRLECDLVARIFRQFRGLAPAAPAPPIALLATLAPVGGIMRIDLDVDVLFRLVCKFLVVCEPPLAPLRPGPAGSKVAPDAGWPVFMEGILVMEFVVGSS